MKDIEKILEKASMQEIQIPLKVEHRIQYTLKNKNKKSWKLSIKKIATVFASLIVILVGGVSAYAAFGGTILGRPIFKFGEMKFLDEYEEYQVKVDGQKLKHNETKMELVSTITDDCYILLEFDMIFSEEDKQLLKLGENYITEKDFESLEQVEDEMKKEYLLKHFTEYKDDINTFYAQFKHVNINDNPVYALGRSQTVTKISDYEYKVYQIYYITDQIWNGKNEFKLTLERCFINTDTERITGDYSETGKLHMGTSGSGGCFYMDGEINVDVSKEKVLENTEIIIPDVNEVKYKQMTKTVEKIEITPMQIIVRISTQRDNVSLNNLSISWNKDYIGITDFDVYGDNGEKLTSTTYETRRTITYADGTVEEWSRGDIGTYKNFYNAKMELEEIIIIEKKEGINSLKIVPTVREVIWSSDRNERSEQEIEFGEINVQIKD